MLEEPDQFYVVLGGSAPGITCLPPQLSDGDVMPVVVKVANLSTAKLLQKYQEYFSGDACATAQAISAAVDYECVFYPAVEGTIKGAHVRMILTDNKVDSLMDAVKYMLAGGDRQLIVKYGVTPWALPKSRLRVPDVIVSGVGSGSTATRSTTPRKKPHCTICLHLMKGHPKPSCHNISCSLLCGDSASSLDGKSPSASPPDTPVSAAEVDDLVKLAQNLTIAPTPPGPADVTIPDVVVSEEDLQRNLSRVFGAITHSAVMMAIGAGAAFTLVLANRLYCVTPRAGVPRFAQTLSTQPPMRPKSTAISLPDSHTLPTESTEDSLTLTLRCLTREAIMTTGGQEEIARTGQMKGAAQVRKSDALALKAITLEWITPLRLQLYPPLHPGYKRDRGFKHSATGSLLCPVHTNWPDEGPRQALRTGETNSVSFWFYFVYRDFIFSPDGPRDSLLKSELLVKAEHLFASVQAYQYIRCIDVLTGGAAVQLGPALEITLPSTACIAMQAG
ncbi:hypothetical protein DXG01_001812 [Tephrocybe rancida]|nr:hypothetical protein DXG01_001812 [Tephrocybe rancida]